MSSPFNRHPGLVGLHAPISASKYHWIRYDDEKFVESIVKAVASARGTRLHELARGLIYDGIKLENTMQTFNMYVNDAIGYRMTPEQVLYYSPNAFGTADAISFRDGILRIFDLKTGVIPAKETQLEIYAAFFCLEYNVRPLEIEYDLRIYQNDEIQYYDTDPEEIAWVMSRVVEADKLYKQFQEDELA